jgi:hypothetical protein
VARVVVVRPGIPSRDTIDFWPEQAFYHTVDFEVMGIMILETTSGCDVYWDYRCKKIGRAVLSERARENADSCSSLLQWLSRRRGSDGHICVESGYLDAQQGRLRIMQVRRRVDSVRVVVLLSHEIGRSGASV